MADIPAALAEYLASLRHRKWQPGSLDCCTFMADWLVSIGFPDPMQDRRGTYSTAAEYRRLLKQEGGLVVSCDRRFKTIGMGPSVVPGPGDVAVVALPFAVRSGQFISRPSGSICLSQTLRAVVGEGKIAMLAAPFSTTRAWSVDAGS